MSQSYEERLVEILVSLYERGHGNPYNESMDFAQEAKQAILELFRESLPKIDYGWNAYRTELLTRWGMGDKDA